MSIIINVPLYYYIFYNAMLHIKYKFVIINTLICIQKESFIRLSPPYLCPLVSGNDCMKTSFFLSDFIPQLLLQTLSRPKHMKGGREREQYFTFTLVDPGRCLKMPLCLWVLSLISWRHLCDPSLSGACRHLAIHSLTFGFSHYDIHKS